MKGFKFYLEYPTNKKKRIGGIANSSKKIIAVCDVNDDPIFTFEKWGVRKTFIIFNGRFIQSFASPGYLKFKCRRVSEQMAREIQKELFDGLLSKQ